MGILDFLGNDLDDAANADCPAPKPVPVPKPRSVRAYKLLRTKSKKALLKLPKRDLLLLCDFTGVILEGDKTALADRLLVCLER